MGPTNITSGRAATEDQLKQVDDQVAANKANITKNAGDIAANQDLSNLTDAGKQQVKDLSAWNVTAAGNSTTVNGAGMTINPANSAASPVSLTVDGLNNGGNQIHGVAPGTADTDAVNVSQLKGAQAGLQEAINRVGVETQRVGAHAAAMAALKPIQYDPLEPTQIMAGIGNYRGETAGAIGLAHYKTEDTMFNIGVTLGSSHNMINAGVTHKFGGNRDRKDAIPERYKAGPISSIYVMQDEVSHLRNQNEEYKSKLEQQQSEIDALKAAVNQLLANKA